MKNLTLEHIARACNGSYHGSEAQAKQEVQSIFTDSRKAAKGGLFVPIKGARVDAHVLLIRSWKQEHLQP